MLKIAFACIAIISCPAWSLNLSFDDIVYNSQEVVFAANPRIGLTKINFSLKRASPFFFRFMGKVMSVTVDGVPQNILVRYGYRESISKVFLTTNLSAGDHTAEIHFQSSSGFSDGTFITAYQNTFGIGPSTYFPSLDIPTSAPNLKLQFPFSREKQVAASNGEITFDSEFVIFSFQNVPTMQALAIVDRSETVQVTRFKTSQNVEVEALIAKKYLAKDSFMADRLKNDVDKVFQKMQALFGPYPWRRLVLYIGPTGGMEYRGGAIINDYGILRHELIHQWFATHVSPKGVQDQWLSEAIDVWLENHYLQNISPDYLNPSEDLNLYVALPALVNPSPFSQDMGNNVQNAYAFYLSILESVDKIARQETGDRVSLLPILREFYRRYQNGVFTTQDFMTLLTETVPYNWNEMFAFYLHGQSRLPVIQEHESNGAIFNRRGRSFETTE